MNNKLVRKVRVPAAFERVSKANNKEVACNRMTLFHAFSSDKIRMSFQQQIWLKIAKIDHKMTVFRSKIGWKIAKLAAKIHRLLGWQFLCIG